MIFHCLGDHSESFFKIPEVILCSRKASLCGWGAMLYALRATLSAERQIFWSIQCVLGGDLMLIWLILNPKTAPRRTQDPQKGAQELSKIEFDVEETPRSAQELSQVAPSPMDGF